MARINGNSGANSLIGTADDDVVRGRRGKDTLDGDGGDDLVLGQGGADLITLGEGADTANGGNGNDVLSWEMGSVVTDPGALDSLIGGRGQDTLTLSFTFDPVATFEMRGDLAKGARVFLAGERIGTVQSVEALFVQASTIGAATLLGGSGADEVRMLAGRLDLTAGAGDDLAWVNTASGVSTLDMGTGDDRVRIVTAPGESQSLRYNARTDDALKVGGEDRVSITGAEAFEIVAGTGSDRLMGLSGDDCLSGGFGRDFLNGRGGDDLFEVFLDGQKNTVLGGAGTDRVLISAAGTEFNETGITMAGTSGGRVKVTQEDVGLQVTGKSLESVQVFGSRGADLLLGLNGDDSLFGGLGGRDTLRGLDGDDTLAISTNIEGGVMVGGDGADVFVITFFDNSEARIEVRDFTEDDLIDANRLFTGGLGDFDLVSGPAPRSRSDLPTFLFSTRTGDLFYDSDGRGDFAPARYAMTLLNDAEAAELTPDQFV